MRPPDPPPWVQVRVTGRHLQGPGGCSVLWLSQESLASSLRAQPTPTLGFGEEKALVQPQPALWARGALRPLSGQSRCPGQWGLKSLGAEVTPRSHRAQDTLPVPL